jgi:lipoprotein signal peptidase
MINRGLLLGLFAQFKYIPIISVWLHLSICFISYLGYRFYCREVHKNYKIQFAFSFLISCQIGSIIDIVRFGGVRDFIVWPGPGIANFLDIYIYIGVFLILIELIRTYGIKQFLFYLFRSGIQEDKRIILELRKETIKVGISIKNLLKKIIGNNKL